MLSESLVCFWGCIRTAWESGPVGGGAVKSDRPSKAFEHSGQMERPPPVVILTALPVQFEHGGHSVKNVKIFVGTRSYLLACVPQFDTMHPSMSLGANFTDRIFTNSFLK